MACHTAIECMQAIESALRTSGEWSASDWIALFSGIASAALAVVAIVVSVQVARFNANRVRIKDRQVARENLREWFSGLSPSAPVEIVEAHRRLDSRIREDIAPYDREALEHLMGWAQDMHGATRAFEMSPPGDPAAVDAAHRQRMVVKWLFRDVLALWVVRPRRGEREIRRLVQGGLDYVRSREVPPAHYHGRETRPAGFRL